MKSLFLSLLLFPFIATAQIPDTVPAKLYKNRDVLEKTLVQNIINKNLSLPAHDSTTSKWNSAFFALQYLHKKSPWIEQRIRYAVSQITKVNSDFQRNLLEYIYGQFPHQFEKEVLQLLNQTEDFKVLSMCAHYLYNIDKKHEEAIRNRLRTFGSKVDKNPWTISLLQHLNKSERPKVSMHPFFEADYLKGNVVVLSLQRKNRDYPGLVLIKDTTGKIVRNEDGSIFNVPQLARSLSGLPGYLTNGNSPQGILRMYGYGISKAGAIGPTPNLQLTLPREGDDKLFYQDSINIIDFGSLKDYKNLLPLSLREFAPLQEAYYAGWAGRHEVIAHGTTVKPQYYSGKPYYPLTPTLGCLCTLETWDDVGGYRKESDQMLLVQAVEKAGGPYGYLIVIEIDDQEKAVSLEDIYPLLKQSGQVN